MEVAGVGAFMAILAQLADVLDLYLHVCIEFLLDHILFFVVDQLMYLTHTCILFLCIYNIVFIIFM